jgi:multiple sugar transport system permease protein
LTVNFPSLYVTAVITGGEPLDSTLLYSLYLYQRAFSSFEMGYSAAMALVLVIVVALVAAAFMRWSSLWVVYAPMLPAAEPASRSARQSRSPAASFAYHLPVALIGVAVISPILWVVANSLTAPSAIRLQQTSLTLHTITAANYVAGWRGFGNISFGTFFANSFFYAGVGTIGAVFSSAMVAYGFARFRFPSRRLWFNCMMLTIILPAQALIIPQYVFFSKLGWVNTYYPLLVPRFFGHPFFILLMIQFILGIPRNLEDAAVLDGCGKGQVLYRIVLPLLRPVMLTSATFSFCWLWDDFLGPLVYLSDPKMHPVSVALRAFADPAAATEWGPLFAMLTLLSRSSWRPSVSSNPEGSCVSSLLRYPISYTTRSPVLLSKKWAWSSKTASSTVSPTPRPR